MQSYNRKKRIASVITLAAVLAAGIFRCAGADLEVQSQELFSGISTDTFSKDAVFEYTPLVRIPKRYSLLEQGRKPAVRSQGNFGTCWTITACSAIESALLPQQRMEFSPDHMSLQNGYDAVQEDGGDYYMIMSYLADGKGPVPEEEDPYGDGVSPEGLEASVQVQDIRLLRGMERKQICQMIMTYGAAQSSLSMDRTRTDSEEYHYYNADTAAYYDPFIEELNHDILILGWDDTYPRENFRIKPKNDGAWICQNSWGEDFGENGIFYVSYEDRNLLRKDGIVYDRITPVQEGDEVHEQDVLGWLARQGYNSGMCWFAGVFHSDRNESVTGIGFYTTGPYTSYRIYLIPEYSDSTDLTRAAGMSEKTEQAQSGDSVRILAAGQIANPGFHTIAPAGEVILRDGQTYAIAVQIDTPGMKNPVAVEVAKDIFTQSVTTKGRETYLSKDGQYWENTQEVHSTNVCLKVFTSSQDTLIR